VKKLIETFDADWVSKKLEKAEAPSADAKASAVEPVAVSAKDAAKAVQIITKELDPLTASVKKAVRIAVAKAGDDVLHDKDSKEAMKKVVKKAVKQAVKEAVHDAQDALDVKDVKEAKA
jgi:hypothetical protein